MSFGIWITGAPEKGKSVLVRAAGAELRALGHRARILDLDEVRSALVPAPRNTEAESDVVYRALVWLAQLLTEAGVAVIVDAAADRRAWRDLARAAIPRFAEVRLASAPDLAREPEAASDPSVVCSAPGSTARGLETGYEPGAAPELIVDSANESMAAAARRIAELAARLEAPSSEPPVPAMVGWTIWVTGRPGSGKTTVATLVSEALAARAVPIRVLEASELRGLLLPDRAGSEADQAILHGAVAYAAKLLTEAGVAVIVDATAQRRAWRDVARQLVPCFAEVQLVCPDVVCLERERAARWGLSGAHPRVHSAGRDPRPDFVLDYEESLHPELTVRTDVDDPRTAAQRVLRLVDRLRTSPATRPGAE